MAEAESDQIDNTEGICEGNLEKRWEDKSADLWKAVLLHAVEFS